MKSKIIYLGISLLIFAILRLLYPHLDNNDVGFLLIPINFTTEIISGTNAEFSVEHGFFYPMLNITIDKSCSGYHFMLIAFLLIAFILIKNNILNKKGFVFLVSLFTAYLIAVITSISRIAGHVLMLNSGVFRFTGRNNIPLHHFEGLFIEISVLVVCYLALNYLINKKISRNEEPA